MTQTGSMLAITVASILLYRERPSLPAVLSIVLVVAAIILSAL